MADREKDFSRGDIDMSQEEFDRTQSDILKFYTELLKSRKSYSTQQYQRWEQIRKISAAIDGESYSDNVKENDEDKDD